jgi:hypothetical protein
VKKKTLICLVNEAHWLIGNSEANRIIFFQPKRRAPRSRTCRCLTSTTSPQHRETSMPRARRLYEASTEGEFVRPASSPPGIFFGRAYHGNGHGLLFLPYTLCFWGIITMKKMKNYCQPFGLAIWDIWERYKLNFIN